MKNENKLKRIQLRQTLLSLAPVLGLLFLFAVFMGIALAKDVNISYSFKNIFNQSLVVIVVATGAI
ncbi:MAG: hypothetical protein KBS81_07895, partial [Spirochaetales bacterium]|nr:hypothetical protein [Candidatus Physcosoma equi]